MNTGFFCTLVLFESITDMGACKPAYRWVSTLHSAQVSSSSERIRRYPLDTLAFARKQIIWGKDFRNIGFLFLYWIPFSSSFLCSLPKNLIHTQKKIKHLQNLIPKKTICKQINKPSRVEGACISKQGNRHLVPFELFPVFSEHAQFDN